MVERDDLYAITLSEGMFTLVLPEPGIYHLSAMGLGYAKPEPVTVQTGSGAPLRIVLKAEAQVLPEVVIKEDRDPVRVGKISLEGRQMEAVAGTQGDPLKGLQSMPGVAVGNDASSNPAIRGSAPRDNLYYLDFMPVAYMFHFGGLTSILPADMVDDFNLYLAAFGPQFGDAMGGVIDTVQRNPRTDRVGVKLNLGMYESDVLIEGPTVEGQSFFLSGRRSYIDFLMNKVRDKISNDQVEIREFPAFYDYQFKYLVDLDERNQIAFHLMGANDWMKIIIPPTSDAAINDPGIGGNLESDQLFDNQGITWRTRLEGGGANRFALGHLHTGTGFVIGGGDYLDIQANDYFIRDEATLHPGKGHELLVGGLVSRWSNTVNFNIGAPPGGDFVAGSLYGTAPKAQRSLDLTGNAWNLYLRDRWQASPRTALIVGVRAATDSYINQVLTEPRLGAEYRLTPSTVLTAGWGYYHQIPQGHEIVDGLGNPNLNYQRAEHRVIGLEQDFGNGWTSKLEGYEKLLRDLPVPDATLNYVNGGSGRIRGMDWLLKRDGAEWNGWLSLTRATSQRTNAATGESFKFSYDQPWIATLVGTWKIDEQWTLGAKWRYHAGSPITPVVGTTTDPGTGQVLPVYGPIGSEILPDYHRLDLRLDRDIAHSTYNIKWYLEILNLYNRKNIGGYRYTAGYASREPSYELPILPSFGIQAEF